MPLAEIREGPMTVKARFAPSPTGYLHVGNIRTAILNYLFCRKHGGTFILRFDDTDRERAKEAFVDAIREDLAWLGLEPDLEIRQSQRTARYDAVSAALRDKGLLYACYETGEEVERRRKRQLARGLPPIYDRAALKLAADEIAAFEAEGRVPHWRFRLPNSPDGSLEPVPTPVTWEDMVRGPQTVDLGSLSDPVMIRADGSYLYTFTSVVDDAEMGITHIVRGEDHVTNTGVQMALFDAIGAAAPVFGHHNLLVAGEGQALSKRLGSLSIRQLREDGLESMAVLSHAALIGTSDPILPHREVGELVALFAPSKISTAPARFDARELEGLNAKLVHELPFDAVSARLQAMGVVGGEPFWIAVRGNLERVNEAERWWRVVTGPVTPVIEDADFVTRAASLLPEGDFDAATWGTWTSAVKAATGAKGKALFHPLRLALTGEGSGPDMKDLLPLIGREEALKRLSGTEI